MLETEQVHCPYCGEVIEILVDISVTEQSYIEDCAVCCCPITFDVSVDQDGHSSIRAKSEND